MPCSQPDIFDLLGAGRPKDRRARIKYRVLGARSVLATSSGERVPPCAVAQHSSCAKPFRRSASSGRPLPPAIQVVAFPDIVRVTCAPCPQDEKQPSDIALARQSHSGNDRAGPAPSSRRVEGTFKAVRQGRIFLTIALPKILGKLEAWQGAGNCGCIRAALPMLRNTRALRRKEMPCSNCCSCSA